MQGVANRFILLRPSLAGEAKSGRPIYKLEAIPRSVLPPLDTRHGSATNLLHGLLGNHNSLIPNTAFRESVQSIIGATEMRRSNLGRPMELLLVVIQTFI